MDDELDIDYMPVEAESIVNYTDNEIFPRSFELVEKPEVEFSIDNSKSFQPSQRSTKNNFIKRDNTVYIHQCNFCYYETPFRSTLKLHFKSCRKSRVKKLWKCPKCNIQYNYDDLTNEHCIPIEGDNKEKNIFHCPACSFSSRGDMQIPLLEKIHPKSKNPFMCPSCDAKILGIGSLKKHLTEIHSVKIFYKCEFCNFIFPESLELEEHKQTHSGQQDSGLIQCSHCHLEFLTVHDIRQHMIKVKWEEESRSKKEREKVLQYLKAINSQQETPEINSQQETPEINSQQETSEINSQQETSEINSQQETSVINSQQETSEINSQQETSEIYSQQETSEINSQQETSEINSQQETSEINSQQETSEIDLDTVEINNDHNMEPSNITDIPTNISNEELLTILEGSNVDEDELAAETSTTNIDNNEIITIEVVSDSDDACNYDGDNKDFSETSDLSMIKKENMFSCGECSFDVTNEFYLAIHEIIIHNKLDENGLVSCPLPGCRYLANHKGKFRKHLNEFHNFNLDIFYSKDLKCPYCIYVAKKPRHLLTHQTYLHKDLSVSRNKSDSLDDRKKVYQCSQCSYKTLLSSAFIKHLNHAHKRTKSSGLALVCKHCGIRPHGRYQLAWHRFIVHKDISELEKWQLRCRVCGFQHYSKITCHRHGMEHEKCYVTFDKIYKGRSRGSIHIRYTQLYVKLTKLPPNVDLSSAALAEKIMKGIENHDDETTSAMLQSSTKTRHEDDERSTKSDDERSTKSDDERSTKSDDERSTKSDDEEFDKSAESMEKERSNNRAGRRESERENLLLEMKDTYFTCTKCIYETKNRDYLHSHEIVVHGAQVCSRNSTYDCDQCDFQSRYKRSYKRHIENVHSFDTDLILAPREEKVTPRYDREKYQEKKDTSNIELSDSENIMFHCKICKRGYAERYQRDWHMFRHHGNSDELNKWRIRCSLCGYETTSKRYSHSHAHFKHSLRTGPVLVRFKYYYKNAYSHCQDYNCPKKEIRCCPKCEFVTGSWECLQKHIKRHRKANFIPHCERLGRIEEKRRKIIEKEGFVKEQDSLTSDGSDDTELENNDEVPRNNSGQEVITIEITSENTENTDNLSSARLNPFSGELVLNNMDDENIDSVEENAAKATIYKCNNADCTYICRDLAKMTKHVHLCSRNRSNRPKLVRKFTCHLCQEVIPKKRLLQNHCNFHGVELDNPNITVKFSEVTNRSFACDIEMTPNFEEPAKEQNSYKSRVSYKCWMCGGLLVTKRTLMNHANIHAREDGNRRLKVRYSKFRDDELEGTVIIQADPKFIINEKRRRRSKSPELEYDPNLPVFSCSDCNFKTNDKSALEKHQNLHWNPEKEALFKAQKWFTCSLCFFHCFNLQTFKEHNEWHKKHSVSTGNIEKVGKNSWFLT